MQKKPPFINIVIIVALGLLTALGGILGNLASNALPAIFMPYLRYVWYSFCAVTAVAIGITVWQYLRQAGSDDNGLIQKFLHHLFYRQHRQQLLAKVRAFWIKGVLEQSLHGAALIALGLQEQPEAVANPWRLVLQQPDQSEKTLPPGTRITQVYDDAGGELLILGEPGSGKTTLLLELARDLLDRAQKDDTHPMPVVFNLSSWAVKRQPLADWLAEELNTKYQVQHELGQLWVRTDQVLPLLDGLDEVASEHRAACVDAINAYRREHGLVPFVVCSRSTEYLTQTRRVQMFCAVAIQPLTAHQIDDYISSAERQLVPLRIALRDDPALQELAAMPLILSILTLAYHGKSVEDLLTAVSPYTQRRQVFETYVQRMLQRRGTETRYASRQTLHWLTWLARQLVQHSLTTFYLEEMSPDWLPDNRSRRVYHIVCGLLVGLLVGLPIWPYAFPFGLLVGLFPSLLCGLFAGLYFQVDDNKLISYLAFGLSLVLVFVLGLMVLTTAMLRNFEPCSYRTIANCAPLDSSIIPLNAVRLIAELLLPLSVMLLVGLSGLILLLMGIQHFTLRWFLWRAGYMPWHYPRFLDYAADRILLRKVGGGYIFVHRLLLEYFASLDTATKSSDMAKQP